jgi:uncharacterized protein YjiK
MKKYIIIFLAVVGTSACDNPWGITKLPEAVEDNFVKMHPTAERVEWNLEQDKYQVEFEISTRERSALFSADGKLLEYSEEIDEQYLPSASMHYLQRNFGDNAIDEVHRVKQDRQTFYRVNLNPEEDAVLEFDENGQLLEQQVQAQTASLLTSSTETTVNNYAPMEPVAKWELPSELREVSGIALLENNIVACVQDEDGVIFLYDLDKKEVTRKIAFAEGGDYEGIAIVENTAYVLRSDGAIYEVTHLQGSKPKVTLHKSVLAESQDTEGLAYDKGNNRLLIAPKGYDDRIGDYKGIYVFSLANKKMQEQPVIKIPLTQEKLQSSGKKQKNKYSVLQPSSLDFNDATGELFLIDAENFLLLTINIEGQVQRLIPLNKDQLRQPEGFAFNDKGELFISSEGSKKEQGVILKYTNGFN